MSIVTVPDSRSHTILVVDDAPATLGMLAEYFENRDLRVVVAQDGEEALQRARLVQPDLILLDVLLPGMDGFETCRRLKADDRTRGIPVIFMTSLIHTESKVTGFEAGGVDYVTKPLQLEEVLARVETHLTLRTLQEELESQNAQLRQEMSERQRAEDALRRANAELESFSYSVSHDLRAPLRGIDGWSLALLEDYSERLDERGRQCLQFVRGETQRMGRLIDDLLELSRVTRGEMRRERVDLSTLARSIADRMQGAEPDRPVDCIIQPGLIAYGDARLLEVLLANLLGNAWKFTSRHPSARIEFGRTEIEGRTVYFVRDDGAGFDMAFARKLFGPFQRMHKTSEFPGSGVGLATVQRIVHRHGGRVWAEAEVEKGATFYFAL